MTMRLTPLQYIMLRIICQYSRRADDIRPGARLTWVPRAKPASVGGAMYHVGGSGDASAIRALEKKGLIKMQPSLGPYAAQSTALGRQVVSAAKVDRAAVLARLDTGWRPDWDPEEFFDAKWTAEGAEGGEG